MSYQYLYEDFIATPIVQPYILACPITVKAWTRRESVPFVRHSLDSLWRTVSLRSLKNIGILPKWANLIIEDGACRAAVVLRRYCSCAP